MTNPIDIILQMPPSAVWDGARLLLIETGACDDGMVRAHRAPMPEEEPLPGKEPAPEEEPAPHPDPEVHDSEQAPPLRLSRTLTNHSRI